MITTPLSNRQVIIIGGNSGSVRDVVCRRGPGSLNRWRSSRGASGCGKLVLPDPREDIPTALASRPTAGKLVDELH